MIIIYFFDLPVPIWVLLLYEIKLERKRSKVAVRHYQRKTELRRKKKTFYKSLNIDLLNFHFFFIVVV